MADSCPSNFNKNSVACFVKRLFYEKKHVLIESFTVLRRSVGLLGQSILYGKIEPDTQTQPTTVTLQRMHVKG